VKRDLELGANQLAIPVPRVVGFASVGGDQREPAEDQSSEHQQEPEYRAQL